MVAATGIPMFMSAAISYGGNLPFTVKMAFLAAGLILQTTIHRTSGMYDGSMPGKLAACLALVCWFGVAYAGRGIAFDILFGPGG